MPRTGRIALILFVGFAILYNANLRQISSDDTRAARYVPLSLLREGNLDVDEYFPHLEDASDAELPYYLNRRGEFLYDDYPPVGPLLAVPVYAPIVMSGIVKDDYFLATLSSKLAGSVMTALAIVFLFLTIHHAFRDSRWSDSAASRIDPHRAALFGSLVIGVGTPMWSTASQALYTHAPVVLGLSASLYCLATRRFALAGLCAAIACVSRPTVTPAAALLLGYVLYRDRRESPRLRSAARFLAPAVLVGTSGMAYNLWLFGNPMGGAAARTQYWLDVLGAESMFSGSLFTGTAGLLINPSLGLLVHSPILVLTFFAAWRLWRWPREPHERLPDAVVLGRVAAVAALATTLVYAKFIVWWGGHAYGPKYLTDAMPFLAILLPFGLPRAGSRSIGWRRASWTVVAVLIVYATVVQAIGVICWPSTWVISKEPPYYERLWDWRYNQITTCVRDGPRLDPGQRWLLDRLGLLEN